MLPGYNPGSTELFDDEVIKKYVDCYILSPFLFFWDSVKKCGVKEAEANMMTPIKSLGLNFESKNIVNNRP